MWAEPGFGRPFGSPLRFDRMPDPGRDTARDGIRKSCPPSFASVPSRAGDGRRGLALRGSIGSRRGFMMEDMADLLSRTAVWALAMLGLWYVFELIAAPR